MSNIITTRKICSSPPPEQSVLHEVEASQLKNRLCLSPTAETILKIATAFCVDTQDRLCFREKADKKQINNSAMLPIIRLLLWPYAFSYVFGLVAAICADSNCSWKARDACSDSSFSLLPSRRVLLSRLATPLVTGVSSFCVDSDVAAAAPPVTTRDTESLGAMAQRALRANPKKLLRRKLSQDFAVLLMRSSYNALDQIDCVAMVGFFCLYQYEATI